VNIEKCTEHGCGDSNPKGRDREARGSGEASRRERVKPTEEGGADWQRGGTPPRKSHEQNGEDRAQYGTELLKCLEEEINEKGLNVTLF
jgi:hypothetical protein